MVREHLTKYVHYKLRSDKQWNISNELNVTY
jgi:hypothetical protein